MAQPLPSVLRLAVLTASYRIPSRALVDEILFTLLSSKDFFSVKFTSFILPENVFILPLLKKKKSMAEPVK